MIKGDRGQNMFKLVLRFASVHCRYAQKINYETVLLIIMEMNYSEDMLVVVVTNTEFLIISPAMLVYPNSRTQSLFYVAQEPMRC